MKKPWASANLVLLVAAMTIACSGSNSIERRDCDYSIRAGIDGTTRDWTDRRCPIRLSKPLTINVEFINSGSAGTVEPPTELAAFQLTHYTVTYRNARTGGTRAGIDVPQPITVSITSVPEVPPLSLNLGNATILTGAAKTLPPLNDDLYYEPNPLAGVLLEATITIWGEPIFDRDADCFFTTSLLFTIFDSRVEDFVNDENCQLEASQEGITL